MNDGLKRTIGLTGLIFYGVGTMVGGGIYALLGAIVGEAGVFAPWSVLFAGLMAVFSALSFAELSARFPVSSGPAKYITEALRNKFLGSVYGWLVICTGVVSAATLTVAISGFLFDMVRLPEIPGRLMVTLVMFAVAAWGIKQSVAAVSLVTTIEVVGLLLVIGVNLPALFHSDVQSVNLLPSADRMAWLGIVVGSFVAFYAFIGFEDLVTLAEEVKSSESTIPKAIVASLVITVVLYVLIALVAVFTVDLASFAASKTPMAYLVRDSRWLSPNALLLISLLAGVNGGLVQVVMASRVLYGMATTAQAPRQFGSVNSKTQTPLKATSLVSLVVFVLAISLDLTTLAKITSGIILFVFASMNLSLILIKRTHSDFDGFKIPVAIPVVGIVLSVGCLLCVLVGGIGVVH